MSYEIGRYRFASRHARRGRWPLAALVTLTVSAHAFAQSVVGLTRSNTLLEFSASAPGSVPTSVAVSGLTAGDVLVGLDFRPASGALYALASSGRLYTVDPASGAATLASTLSTPPSGTTFAVDFNPVADRLRVISDSGQSLRVNVDTGAATVDGAINPAGPQVVEAAYTNSVAGATATMLYDIDIAGSQLLLQTPPNDGTVTVVGPLGVAIEAGTGFDVLSVGANNTAYAALRVAATTGLYTIDLAAGTASLVAAVGGNPVLVGITATATPLPTAPPAAGTALALDSANNLIRFATASPATVIVTTPVTGLQSGDTLVGIDVRPATGELFGLTDGGRLYTIDPASGASALASTLDTALGGSAFAIDFNPTVDRLRIVSNSGQNLRVNVDTGAATVDGAINPPGTQLAGVGYTNSVAGATATGLYYLDAANDALFLQSPPNNGTLAPIGAFGAAFDGPGDIDVLSANGSNTAFAAIDAGGVASFYTVDLVSGAATRVAAIGGNPDLRGLAVVAGTLPPPPGGGGDVAPIPVNSRFALALFGLLMIAFAAVAMRRRSNR